ncbi:hypothetical protein COCOBI_07-0010 [Coccomyxa sp. Obi]|nr:hypothetical protein COCOBI_07-0010 [Coccomyxa sp. Obi]
MTKRGSTKPAEESLPALRHCAEMLRVLLGSWMDNVKTVGGGNIKNTYQYQVGKTDPSWVYPVETHTQMCQRIWPMFQQNYRDAVYDADYYLKNKSGSEWKDLCKILDTEAEDAGALDALRRGVYRGELLGAAMGKKINAFHPYQFEADTTEFARTTRGGSHPAVLGAKWICKPETLARLAAKFPEYLARRGNRKEYYQSTGWRGDRDGPSKTIVPDGQKFKREDDEELLEDSEVTVYSRVGKGPNKNKGNGKIKRRLPKAGDLVPDLDIHGGEHEPPDDHPMLKGLTGGALEAAKGNLRNLARLQKAAGAAEAKHAAAVAAAKDLTSDLLEASSKGSSKLARDDPSLEGLSAGEVVEKRAAHRAGYRARYEYEAGRASLAANEAKRKAKGKAAVQGDPDETVPSQPPAPATAAAKPKGRRVLASEEEEESADDRVTSEEEEEGVEEEADSEDEASSAEEDKEVQPVKAAAAAGKHKRKGPNPKRHAKPPAKKQKTQKKRQGGKRKLHEVDEVPDSGDNEGGKR